MFGDKGDSVKIARQEFAVIGLGRFGSSVARKLVQDGHTVLGVDRDMNLVQRYSHLITQTLSFDSTDLEALKEADIPSYGAVVVAIGTNFEANLLTTVALKELHIKRVICKATTEMQKDILLKVGADQVVLPEQEAGERLAVRLTSPGVVGQMSLSEKQRISEIKVPNSFVGLNLEDVELNQKYNLDVVAIQRGDQVFVSPKKGTVLREADLLVVIGPGKGVHDLSSVE